MRCSTTRALPHWRPFRLSAGLVAALLVAAAAPGCSGGGCFGSGATSSAGPDTASHPVPPPPSALGTALATVNGQPVGTVAADRARGMAGPREGSNFSDGEKQGYLDQAVDDEVLFLEAFKRGLYQEPGIRRSMIAALLRAEVYDGLELPEPTEEEMRAWFTDHRDQFVIPERIHLLRIFLGARNDRDPAATAALAEELIATLRADPARFGELAREHSDGPLALRGGDAGFLSREGRPEVPGTLVAAAFELAEGEVSEPIPFGDGLNILYVATRRPRVERDYDAVRPAIRRRMNQEAIEAARTTFLSGLRNSARIEIDEAAVTEWRPRVRTPGAPFEAPEEPTFQAPEGFVPEKTPMDEKREMVDRARAGEPEPEPGE